MFIVTAFKSIFKLIDFQNILKVKNVSLQLELNNSVHLIVHS